MDANVDVLAYMELISNTGFPIVIAMYLLHRMEKKLDALVGAIEHLIRAFKSSHHCFTIPRKSPDMTAFVPSCQGFLLHFSERS